MATSKTKLTVTQGKTPSSKLGALSSSATSKSAASPLTSLGSKKNYKKSGSQQVDFGTPSFGQTGMTGES